MRGLGWKSLWSAAAAFTALGDVPPWRSESPPYLITYSLSMAYWSMCLSHMPTTTASLALIFEKQSLNAVSTYAAVSQSRPDARILYTKHGFLVCWMILYISGGSPRTNDISPP